MLRKRAFVCLSVSALLLTACGGDDQATLEVAPANQTRVIFSPASSELPLPNDLLFEQGENADGTLSVSSCDDGDQDCLAEEAANPVISGIDLLDGASTIAPIDVFVEGSLDPNQTLDTANFISLNGAILPNPNQNIFLLPLIYPSGDSVLQVEGEIPSLAEAISYQRAVALADTSTLADLANPTARAEILSQDGGTNNVIRISPIRPLAPKTKYLVVITNVTDSDGNPIAASIAYDSLRNPDEDLSRFGSTSNLLAPVREAILGWERLASGYFGFKQQVFTSAQIESRALTASDIIASFTFTTGGTKDVLESIAAPEVFFEETFVIDARKDAISKVVDGTYNLSGTLNASLSETDNTVIATLNLLLTSPIISDAPNPLFNEAISNAVTAGATLSNFTDDATATFIIQSAAAEAAVITANSDGITLAQEAQGTVSALATAVGGNPANLFPLPQSRESLFFRVDSANEINSLLEAPASVYQGEINLPQFIANPTENPSLVLTGRWQASTAIGSFLDAANGAPANSTPPSNQITYRYPFPELDDNTRVPVLVTTPDEATLGPLGITRPENGWPVVLYIHGIRSDRSASLSLANALAFACVDQNTFMPTGLPCFATVAIDQPLHGIAAVGSIVPGLTSYNDPNTTIVPNVPTDSPNSPSLDVTERHFDLTANLQNLPIQMDYSAGVGESGSLFINLVDFGKARDNLRQLVVDMLNLNASLDSMDLNGDGTPNELDPNNVFVAAMSLGAINGIPFVAINNSEKVQSSPFNGLPKIKGLAAFNTGGGIPRLLTNSNAFAATILQGLEIASDGAIAQGNSALEAYLSTYQGVLDSIDPLNFATSLSDQNSDIGVFLSEIIGDGGTTNLPDQTIPNAADSIWGNQFGPLQLTVPDTGFVIDGFPAPLAGTEPLIAQFRAVETGSETDDGDPSVTVTRYSEGNHSTPISADNPAVFFDIVATVLNLFSESVSD